jgi:hypothetical protein
MIVEDRIAQEEKKTAAGGGELPAPLPSLPKLLKAHVLVAPRLVLLYALRQLRDGDEARLCQLLPLLAPLGAQLDAQVGLGRPETPALHRTLTLTLTLDLTL